MAFYKNHKRLTLPSLALKACLGVTTPNAQAMEGHVIVPYGGLEFAPLLGNQPRLRWFQEIHKLGRRSSCCTFRQILRAFCTRIRRGIMRRR
jgi:hypothetical protein